MLELACLFFNVTGQIECSHQCPHFTFFKLPLPAPLPSTPSPHPATAMFSVTGQNAPTLVRYLYTLFPHPPRRNPSHGADTAVGVHPGIVDTYLAGHFFKTQGVAWTGGRGAWAGSAVSAVRQAYNSVIRASKPLLFRTPEAAASTVLYAALAPAAEVAGRYVVPPACTAIPAQVLFPFRS